MNENQIAVVRRAIAFQQPNSKDAIDILSKVCGLEMAAMVGAMIAAAQKQIPILLDGFISTVSACVAQFLTPGVENYMTLLHKMVIWIN